MFGEKFKKFDVWFEKYDRHISSAGLLIGFIIDNLTLQRIDRVFDNTILLAYIFLSGFGLFVINMYEGGRLTHPFFVSLRKYVPLVIQYALGGLFSGFFIFYSRSATLGSSWLFILLLLLLLLGNEFLKKQYARLTFQISVYFVAVFSYLIFIVPILFNRLGAFMFILSGVFSLMFIYCFIWLINKVVPDRIRQAKRLIIFSISVIFVGMHVMYFTNIIPPIPLSLKEGGVYHAILRTSENAYLAEQEERRWYEFLDRYTDHTISAGQGAYVFSSIFAPTDIVVPIIHEWQLLNEVIDEWETKSRVQFTISGGRSDGYRGYTQKNDLSEGKWRVNITTKRGQTIGRVYFRVVYSDVTVPFKRVEL